MVNAYWEPLAFQLPDPGSDHTPWRRCIDTALASPHDVSPWGDAPTLGSPTYRVEARSVVVLVAGPRAGFG